MKYLIITTVAISCVFLYKMDKDKRSYLKELNELKQVNVSLSNEVFAKDSLIINADEFFPNNKTKEIVKFKKNYFQIKINPQ